MLIVITEPGRPPIEQRCEAETVIIGRSQSCDVIVDRPFVSGRHLRVLGGVVAHDMGSTNGTFLDGQRLERPEWIVGRTLTLGGLEVELRIEPTDGVPVAGPQPLPSGPVPEQFHGREALRFVEDIEALIARVARQSGATGPSATAPSGGSPEISETGLTVALAGDPRIGFIAHLEALRRSLEASLLVD